MLRPCVTILGEEERDRPPDIITCGTCVSEKPLNRMRANAPKIVTGYDELKRARARAGTHKGMCTMPGHPTPRALGRGYVLRLRSALT